MTVQICDCGRGKYYEDEQYSSCYECFEERFADYSSCIYCGRWHSPRYNTCYQCRVIHHREDAGRDLRISILMRDDFQCQNLRCRSRERAEVDHIFPCASGGTADVWNLQVLCHDCNHAKGRSWAIGSSHWGRRVALMQRYFTFWWDWLDDEERDRLVADAGQPEYLRCFEWRTRYRLWLGAPIGNWPDEQESDVVMAALGIAVEPECSRDAVRRLTPEDIAKELGR